MKKPLRTKGRMCAGKRRHPTRGKALAHMRQLVRRGAASERLNVYECPHCGGWHVGHLGKER